MDYQEQLKIEQLNKDIFENIIKTVKPEDFIKFYINHNQKETLEYYKLRNIKQLTKILKAFNYDFSKPKPSKFKGKKAARSHDSYIEGGKKSAQTQKDNWANKSPEEKEAWSIKQSIAHTISPTFKNKITEANRQYRLSLTEEERKDMDARRSIAVKTWWENLTPEEKDEVLNKRAAAGTSYTARDSKPNLKFKSLLEQNNIKNIEREFELERKFFDFKIGDTLVEINPTFTHNSTFTPFEYNKPLAKNYHKLKSEIATKNNYRCIHIFDWDDKNKVINLIKADQETIYARECKIKQVEKQEAIDFLFLYHLQNYARDEIRIGLYYKNELVSLMTFGKPRYNKNYQYELIRYCSKAKVIGGAEKLFKHFIDTYNPASILSYCDLSKFNGDVYNKLGFKLLKVPGPSKHWYNIRTKEHYTDSLLRQQGFSRLIHHCDAKEDNLKTNNNAELMIEAGFVEIYDCGQATYIWQK